MFEDCNDWALELYPDKNKLKAKQLAEAYGIPYDAPKDSIYKQLRKIADGKEQGTIDGVNWVETLSFQDQLEIKEINERIQSNWEKITNQQVACNNPIIGEVGEIIKSEVKPVMCHFERLP